MASDINEQFFNEKQLYTGDVLEEDADVGLLADELNKPTGDAGSASSPCAREKAPERRKKKRATQIVYWLETKYDVLPQACASFENWREAPSANFGFDLLWCDTAIPAERFMKLRPYQKMNHFVGMSSITRKNNLGRNLLRMRKQFPKEYRFFPDTWILPTDLSDFKMQFGGKGKTFIIKPDNGCQGKGIFLIRDVEKVPVDFSTTYVAQRYIHRPFLLDGYKFDLRLYVLVLGCDPLRIFLHRRGLVRLASDFYEEPSKRNIEVGTMHLTNYAINKLNPDFQENTDPEDAESGHKRSLEAVFDHLRSQGYDVDTLQHDIEDLIIKTLITVQPSLSHFYRSCQPDDIENSMCFEVLGFDVILDHKLQPWLLEVNHAPSFATESELDQLVKEEVLKDTFHLLNLTPEARRQKKREAKLKMEQRSMGVLKKQSAEDRMTTEQEIAIARTAWEDQNLNGYKRLYPSEAKEKEYMHIHDAAVGIWEMLMGGNSRRSVRLLANQPEAQGKEAKNQTEDGSKGGKAKANRDADHDKGKAGDEGSREKRTVEELREIVDRLSAGLGAASRRPKREDMGRQDQTDDDQPSGVTTPPVRSAPEGPAQPTAVDPPVTSHAVTPHAAAVPAAAVPETSPWKMQASNPLPAAQRFEVKVGDIIKVETTLGWEKVVVKAKRNNGKIDIQFKDGEYMRAVLPRIMRESTQTSSEATRQLSESSRSTRYTQHPPNGDGQPGDATQADGTVSTASAPLQQGSMASPKWPTKAATTEFSGNPASSRTCASSGSANGSTTGATSMSFGATASEPKSLQSASTIAPQVTGTGTGSQKLKSADKGDLSGTDSTHIAGLCAGRRRDPEAQSGPKRTSPMAPGPLSLGRCPPRGPSPVTSVAPPPASLQEIHRVHEARLRQQLQQLISVRHIVTQRQPYRR